MVQKPSQSAPQTSAPPGPACRQSRRSREVLEVRARACHLNRIAVIGALRTIGARGETGVAGVSSHAPSVVDATVHARARAADERRAHAGAAIAALACAIAPIDK